MKSSDYINKATGEIRWEVIFSTLKKLLDCEIASEEESGFYMSSTNKLIQLLYNDANIKDKFHFIVAAIFRNICKYIKNDDVFKHVTSEKIARLLLWDDDLEFRELVCYLIRTNKVNTIPTIQKNIDISLNYNIKSC
jgi:hypothetical protein